MDTIENISHDAAALKRALEQELSLDNRDLRSHAWYHGAISRTRAEEIIREDGQFLVRDCISQPGKYVLTCRSKNQPLHFVIDKTILQQDTVYERVQYQFEDESFDTIPDLITSYVTSGKPITLASGARIQYPKNRMYPLSTNFSSKINYKTTQPKYTAHSISTTKCAIKKQRSRSLTPCEVNKTSQEKYNSADGIIDTSANFEKLFCNRNCDILNSSQSLPRTPRVFHNCSTQENNDKNVHNINETSTATFFEKYIAQQDDYINMPRSPPPKPLRIPTLMKLEFSESDTNIKQSSDGNFQFHRDLHRLTSYLYSGSDSGNGSGDSSLGTGNSDIADVNKHIGVVIKNPYISFFNHKLKNLGCNYADLEEELLTSSCESVYTSQFNLDNFHTILLPPNENKPLDKQALKGIKLILKETGSQVLANHLTKIDYEVIFAVEKKYGKNINKYFELGVLLEGGVIRQDLIERCQCLKYLVAVTILSCSDTTEQLEMLNKWIKIAGDTKAALGNLFGFSCIMLGLLLPQIQKLDTTWHSLRQQYTDTAFNFEANLRPTFKNMNNCTDPLAPNTSIPHLMPFILLLERTLDNFLNMDEYNSLSSLCLGTWEGNSHDLGLGILFNHIDAVRKFSNERAAYKKNADVVLVDARIEELTLDLFRTEFHLKFLWGSRGAIANAQDRHSKFEELLNIMVEKFEVQCN